METAFGRRYALTAPHRLATLAGTEALSQGASAIEAMVAAAATIAVVYPHMNGLGGDAFWLIKRPGEAPRALMGCGRAGAKATPKWYADKGITQTLPTRGPLAAITVPGAVDSWQCALHFVPEKERWPLADLLAPAIDHARQGVATSRHQAELTAAKYEELKDVPGFADVFLERASEKGVHSSDKNALKNNRLEPFHDPKLDKNAQAERQAPRPGWLLRQEALADTLEHIARAGCDSFYRGDIAHSHAEFLNKMGSPLCLSDFNSHSTKGQDPLQITTSWGTLYNTKPPTQGLASLAILGIFDRLKVDPKAAESFAHLHGLIEATKQAYLVRNRELGDPDAMSVDPQALLAATELEAMTAAIDPRAARAWPEPAQRGDTIWMGAADADGTVVSFIQSIFWEFGSGLVCPQTGVLFQNRGADFTLSAGPRELAPGRLPFHTLNPALAQLSDGRIMAYGTQGGDGQPQTQAAIFSRYAHFGVPLQKAISRPRWLLGKSWGAESTTLKLEADIGSDVMEALKRAGHAIETVPPCNGLMGHAGAVTRHCDGFVEAATDPRSDGAALAR